MTNRRKCFKNVVMLLSLVGIICLSACAERKAHRAELLAMEYPDSAAAYLATVDTTRMKEGERALYTLTRALVLEEKWQQEHADTAVCLHDNEDDWSFKRKSSQEKGTLDEELDGMMADSSLLRAYYYYEEKSMGGVTDDEEDLRRFGRICYVLSRQYQDNDTLLQADQLFLLAIHCAEACGDDETAYRAYHLWGRHLLYVHGPSSVHETYWCLQQALKHFDRCRNNAQWLLTLVNDYGWVYLSLLPLNPRNFPTLIHAANIVWQGEDKTEAMYDSVSTLIDSVANTPMLPFDSRTEFTSTYDGKITVREQSIPKGLFMDAEQTYKDEVKNGAARSSVKSVQEKFEKDRQQAISHQSVQTRTYLAAGYARKAAMLQSRLLWSPTETPSGTHGTGAEGGTVVGTTATEGDANCLAAWTHHRQERDSGDAGTDGRETHNYQCPELARNRGDARHGRRTVCEPTTGGTSIIQRGRRAAVYAHPAETEQCRPVCHLRHLGVGGAASEAKTEERRLRRD